MVSDTVSKENLILTKELLSRGYSVLPISRGTTIDYLIVSTGMPDEKQSEDVTNAYMSCGIIEGISN